MGDEAASASLTASFGRSPGWLHEVTRVDDAPGTLRVKLVSPEVVLSREAFLELADVMMIAAEECACVFDGFQVDVAAIRRRPWWRV